MNWIRSIAKELFGLFVDDGRFAVAILVWVGLIWGVTPNLLPVEWGGPVLFAGLGAILLWSTARRARR